LGIQPKMGGRFHLKLNIVWKPIEKKYSDGKVKRTLKKGLKVLEMVKRERNKIITIDNSLKLRTILYFFFKKKYKFVFFNI